MVPTGARADSRETLCELPDVLTTSPFYNHDIAPTRSDQRRWGVKDIAVLWISMSACIPTYMLASGLINEGMNWWQAITTICLGNLIVLLPMILNAHPGTKYGIPFPVYCRAAFGILGANVPAMLRAFVACGWFGIQTWIGGWAIYRIGTVFFPSWEQFSLLPVLGINVIQFACFMFFWSINMLVIYKGIESIRILLNVKAPLLIALGLALLAWAYNAAGGFGPMLSQPSQFAVGGPKEGKFWSFFVPALTANVGFWATLALNIPDFSRYARSQRDQMVGQILGLPTTMSLYAFIGVAVTSATVIIYGGDPIWDPVVLVSKFTNRGVLIVAMISLCLATLATNIAANVVSPANDFAHLWPRRISFRVGGFITGVIGILIQPWQLVANASVYIDKWLVGYSSLLGAVGGILIADYFIIRKTRLELAGLYQKDGPYWYTCGVNLVAIFSLIAGIAPCVPGFMATVGLVTVGNRWLVLYHYAWFVSFGVSFLMYMVLTKAFGRAMPHTKGPV